MPTIFGGLGIINPNVRCPGTIGMIIPQNSTYLIVSCYHVLCRLNRQSFVKGEPICLADDNGFTPIAIVNQGFPLLDVASAEVVSGVEVSFAIDGFSQLGIPKAPEIGMEVVKIGAATGRTEGRIFQIDEDEIWIEPLDDDAAPISAGGDSGAIWLEKNLLAPIALHTGTNSTGLIPYARGINIIRVLSELKLI